MGFDLSRRRYEVLIFRKLVHRHHKLELLDILTDDNSGKGKQNYSFHANETLAISHTYHMAPNHQRHIHLLQGKLLTGRHSTHSSSLEGKLLIGRHPTRLSAQRNIINRKTLNEIIRSSRTQPHVHQGSFNIDSLETYVSQKKKISLLIFYLFFYEDSSLTKLWLYWKFYHISYILCNQLIQLP